jgi:hypothetical protein
MVDHYNLILRSIIKLWKQLQLSDGNIEVIVSCCEAITECQGHGVIAESWSLGNDDIISI